MSCNCGLHRVCLAVQPSSSNITNVMLQCMTVFPAHPAAAALTHIIAKRTCNAATTTTAACMQTLRFESYRDLVRLAARGVSEAQGLAAVDAESLDRRAAQHAALQAATDAVYFNPKPGGAAASGPGSAAHGAAPAGTGVYSAIGFSYDSSAGGPAGAAAGPSAAGAGESSDSSSEDDSDEDLDDDEDAAALLAGQAAGGAAGPVSEAELAQEAEDERVDDMAEAYGLADFCYRLHRALEKEGEEEARMRKRPR